MKVVIFAGGTGRRLWPISRQRSPKQFEPIIGDRSTLQLAVERVEDLCGLENIFISTNERYVPLVARQLPRIAVAHLIGEPMRRDLAAAVGLSMIHLAHMASPTDTVAILWGDNTMADVDTFRRVLTIAEQLIQQKKADILFIGETPRFANENLGWIGLGPQRGSMDGWPYYGFESLTYRPPLEECRHMMAAGSHVWNTGYFVTTVGFVCDAYRTYQPEMWASLEEIGATIGQPDYARTLARVYATLPEMSFDDAILTHLPAQSALVLHGEMGWSDPGTLYALKEAISPHAEDNVTKGLVRSQASRDSLLYNYEADKLLVAIGLEGMIVVNTEDAILVVHKDHIPLVKKVVNGLEGTDLEHFS
ncbi:MAG: mannose-1-phosphate guanylyltransferase [Anaerolineales bacterium]|nr:mannose-1-phosphate guanylyltransferase [Anaerolineales bacterium]MCB8954144.1 mannose-1-phosphate guanylyltransferase [Ardenticatenales bacterium]